MINSTNTININDTVLNEEMLKKTFSFQEQEQDRFTRWVVRPLVLLAGLGVGGIMLFASAFLVLLSLATLPLIAIGLWAINKKVQRDLAAANPVVDTQSDAGITVESSAQASE